MNIMEEFYVKKYAGTYIDQCVQRQDSGYLSEEIISEIWEEYNIPDREGRLEIFRKVGINIRQKILEISDEEYLWFIKAVMEYIYKMEYGKTNDYETFDPEPEDNYYWILEDFLWFHLSNRKLDSGWSKFFLEKLEETLVYLRRKNEQSLRNEPEDNIWCQEGIDRLEKYIERTVNWEYLK